MKLESQILDFRLQIGIRIECLCNPQFAVLTSICTCIRQSSILNLQPSTFNLKSEI